jgi:hypothetical protein
MESAPPDSADPADDPQSGLLQVDPSALFSTTRPPEGVIMSLPLDGDPDAPLSEQSELDEAIEALVYRRVSPPPELRGVMFQILEKRRVQALMDGEYDIAEQHDKISGLLQTTIQAEQERQNQDRALDALFQRWQQLQSQQQQITAKWDLRLSDFIAESDQQREDLQRVQDLEIEHFIARWKDPSFLHPFSKPSQKLLQLREQERAMGIARMYSQAKEMKAAADRLQREETQAAQARMNAQMAAERHKLSLKHEREMKSLAAYRERGVKSIQAEKAKELRPIQSALLQMKAKKATPTKLPSPLPSLPPSRGDSPSTASGENLCSPRTATRYSYFRSEKRRTVLDVAPVDDALLEQMKKPTTSTTRPGRPNSNLY